MSIHSIHPDGAAIQPQRGMPSAQEKQGTDDVKSSGEHKSLVAGNAPARSDRVELSDDARRLAADRVREASSPEATGTLAPEKLATVTKRLSEGFYDRQDVRHETARRLLADLYLPSSE